MRELLYDDAALKEIREKFPHVRVEDASDFIHTNRVEIELPDAEREEFYKDSIRQGYCDVLLGFQVRLYQPEGQAEIRRWIDEIEAEKTKVQSTEGGPVQ